jgi:hypothetical protein
MLIQTLPGWLALLSALGMGLSGLSLFLHWRDGWRDVIGRVITLCLSIACLIGSAFLPPLGGRQTASESASGTTLVPEWAMKAQSTIISVGMPAPDFTLPSASDGHPIHLADMLGRRPAVLIFGSFGCNLFCNRLDDLRQLHEKYKDRAEFLFVYVQEAPHPFPERLRNVTADPNAPMDAPENRLARVRAGLEHFGLAFPCVLDTEDGQALKAYGAYPQRIVLIDKTGRIAQDVGHGLPGGLRLWYVTNWLDKYADPPESDRVLDVGAGQ